MLDASLSESNNDYESSVFFDDQPQIPRINQDGISLSGDENAEDNGGEFSHETLSLSLAKRSVVSDRHSQASPEVPLQLLKVGKFLRKPRNLHFVMMFLI